MNNDLYLSASTYKLFKSCSLKYYYSKVVKVPEDTNQGALSGGVVHECLEYLLKPRRRKLVEQMLSSNTLTNPVRYFLLKRCAQVGVLPEKTTDTEQMVLAALSLDFLAKNGEVLGTEIEFNIENKEPYYKIKGYIDVLIKYGKKIVIRDYKSSKSLFTEKELEKNLQGYIYTLAVEDKYPDLKVDSVEFIMLKFLEKQVFKVSKKELNNFKKDLAAVYKEVAEFGPENRFDNVARYKKQDEDGSFSGELMCGFAFYKGHLKKDGSPRYSCPYKFSLEYYALMDKNGALLQTSLKKEELTKELKDGRFIVTKQHKGCEAWK